MPIPESVRYRIKGTQSGTRMLRYQTEIPDAGMPMPAASVSMPVPGHAKDPEIEKESWKKELNHERSRNIMRKDSNSKLVSEAKRTS